MEIDIDIEATPSRMCYGPAKIGSVKSPKFACSHNCIMMVIFHNWSMRGCLKILGPEK